MKKTLCSLLFCVTALSCITVPAFAAPEELAPEDDTVMLYTGTIPTAAPAGDPLCNAINEKRSLSGSVALELNDELMEQAAARVEAQSGGSAGADCSYLTAADAGETVIRGNADINTMLSAMMLSSKQVKSLVYSGYTQFGYAHNEEETVWVLLFTS